MENNYFNSEGYHDPTAGAAIRNADSFRIDHPTGYVQIETDSFFPCTVKRSKKLFRMVRLYCSPEQQEELLKLMLKKSVALSSEALRLDNILNTLDIGTKAYKETLQAMLRVKRQHSQLTRNVKDFTSRRSPQ